MEFEALLACWRTGIHAFFNKQHFYKQRPSEIGKSQAKAKKHAETELQLFENYSLFHPLCHLKIMGEILENVQKASARVSFLIKLQAASATLLKKRLWHRGYNYN